MRGLAWLAVILVVAAVDPPDVTTLLRASQAAAAGDDLVGAAALLEQAQRLAPDPGLVAYNLATLRYQQARQGNAPALAAAEVAYGCLLDPGEPRRARALLGLGNCLLLRGSTGALDGVALRAAIDRYTECVRDPGCTPELAAAAAYNQEHARLLLAQTPPPPGDAADDEGKEPSANPDSPPGTTPERAPRPGGSQETPDPREKTGAASPTEAAPEQGTRPTAGKGNLAPVPSAAGALLLSAQDAGEHVERAAERILEERRAHRRARTRPVVPGVRDW